MYATKLAYTEPTNSSFLKTIKNVFFAHFLHCIALRTYFPLQLLRLNFHLICQHCIFLPHLHNVSKLPLISHGIFTPKITFILFIQYNSDLVKNEGKDSEVSWFSEHKRNLFRSLQC